MTDRQPLYPSRAFELNGRRREREGQLLSLFFASECSAAAAATDGMIDAERRGNRRCANKRKREKGRRKWSVADRRKEGGKDGSAGKSLKRENKRGLDWMARVEWMVGWRGRGSVAFYGIAAESS